MRSEVAEIAAYTPEGWQSLVECTGLENRQALAGLGGSNPSPSAISRQRPSGAAFSLLRCGESVLQWGRTIASSRTVAVHVQPIAGWLCLLWST